MDAPDPQSVRSLMTASVYSISPNDSAQSAARLMLEADVGMLPVEAPGVGAILGVITDRDILVQVMAKALPTSTAVCEFMTVSAETCFADHSVLSAAQQMLEARLHRLVVVDEGRRAVGILTLSDILRAYPSIGSMVQSGLKGAQRQAGDAP